jgi:uncharacterized protein (UPF0147 family)
MTRTIEQQILTLLMSSIEDTRVPDAIAAHADKRAGKPVTKTDAEQLEAQIGIPVRIRRQYGMTHVSWGTYKEERSILLAHSESNVRWPTGEELRKKEPAYFGARDYRNAARKKLLQEHVAIADQSAICRAASAIAKLREAQAELEKLVEYGEPLHVVCYDVQKLTKEDGGAS